jgi:small subunit ribosomal protein S20
MPNTKSAAKQARASERRRINNRSIKSRLHTLERAFMTLVSEKKASEASAAYSKFIAALDKAAKTGVVHRNLANRKKSRLSVRLKAVGAPAAS